MLVEKAETQGVLADINRTLREYAAPTLAERVERLLDSAVDDYNGINGPDWAYCELDCEWCFPEHTGAEDPMEYGAEDAAGGLLCNEHLTSEFELHRQKKLYSYEIIEGYMKDWRGNDYYRGDRILYPRAVNGGCWMTEAIYDEPIYAEGQEPKIIGIYAIPVASNSRLPDAKRVRLTNLENITAVAA